MKRHLILCLFFLIFFTGCNLSGQNQVEKNKTQVSPELQKAIKNIDNLDSKKLDNIPYNDLNVNF